MFAKITRNMTGWYGRIRSFGKDEQGIGTLEIVLIAAVLIAVALLFKEWILDFLKALMDKVEGKTTTFFD